MTTDRRPTETESYRGLHRPRLATDARLLVGLDRIGSHCNPCVATNLTIRRINRRDSAVVQVVGGAALGAAMQRSLAHYFTWLNGNDFFSSTVGLRLPPPCAVGESDWQATKTTPGAAFPSPFAAGGGKRGGTGKGVERRIGSQ